MFVVPANLKYIVCMICTEQFLFMQFIFYYD